MNPAEPARGPPTRRSRRVTTRHALNRYRVVWDWREEERGEGPTKNRRSSWLTVATRIRARAWMIWRSRSPRSSSMKAVRAAVMRDEVTADLHTHRESLA